MNTQRVAETLQQRLLQLTAAAEREIQLQSGGAALCRLPGVAARDAVKAAEGRLAVLTALRRALRDGEDPALFVPRLAALWQAALAREAARPQPSADWLAYRRGGAAVFAELQDGAAAEL
jgi:phosphatidylserine/phosphatidylglycerophosphate/cardiolipin synthase-like enzyme